MDNLVFFVIKENASERPFTENKSKGELSISQLLKVLDDEEGVPDEKGHGHELEN